MPKKPKTAYTFYTSENLKNCTADGTKVTERMKQLGEQWKSLSDAEKKKY